MNTSMTIAVDLAKNVFELALADSQWQIVERHRLSRSQFQRFFANRPPATVVMEACGSAHYWGRYLQRLGFGVRLLPAQHVKPYRRGNKNDRNDACALLEAGRCAEILDVPVKRADQQAMLGLHRIRSQWMASRTARINTLRGLLREQGITLPGGARAGVQRALQILDEADIAEVLAGALYDLIDEIHSLERRIGEIEKALARQAKVMPAVGQLMQIPGIGLLTATALVASVGSPEHFRSGRHLAAWLGLTPKQNSSGLRQRLGRISKRGDIYLRMLLIHGARSVLQRARVLARQGKPLTRLQQWALQLNERCHPNKATVAVANKLARIVWAVWFYNRSFDGNHALAA